MLLSEQETKEKKKVASLNIEELTMSVVCLVQLFVQMLSRNESKGLMGSSNARLSLFTFHCLKKIEQPFICR